MEFYLSLPLTFFAYFFIELPLSVMRYFISLNKAFLQLFSLPLIIRTFFVPWKNEYRSRYIPVALGLGITIKTMVIFVNIVLFILLLLCELLFVLFIMLWPIVTILLLFL